MNSVELDKLLTVAGLFEKGFGRRRIAAELKISEWEARNLIHQYLTGIEKSPEPVAPTNVTAKTLNLIRSSSPLTHATSIKVVSSATTDETPSRLIVRGTTLKVACLSDIHYPYQDIKAEEIALNYLKDYKPDIVVWNGDIFDFYSVSQYEKSAAKKMDIQQEIDYGFERMKLWVSTLGSNTQHYFRAGNHETRLGRLIKKMAPSLASLRSTRLEENIDFKSLGIKYIPDHQELMIGNMMFIHGTVVRKHAGDSARGHFDQYGCSLTMGHTHRLSVTYKRTKAGSHTLVENGTLCDFDVEYAQFPDWQHGFTTYEFDGDDFSVHQHAIIGYKLIANGAVYML